MRRKHSAAAASALAVAALLPGCRQQRSSMGLDGGPASAPVAVVAAAAEPVRKQVVIYPAAPGSFVEITAEAAPALVSIRSTRKVLRGPGALMPGEHDEFALGTGFLIDTEGYILTNDHVIANATELRVVLSDGNERAARIAGRDPKLDVALLKIDSASRMLALPLGDSDRAQVGEWVVALGDAFGRGATVSAGVVSALDQLDSSSLVQPDTRRYRAYLQTDASVHPGNSGGPLLNMAGEVIGISTAVASSSGPVGYAVPINRARAILPQLKASGTVSRSWLGVYVRPLTDELAQKLGMSSTRGAFVTSVYHDSPARRAGVQRGDIILSLGGTEVDHRSLPWRVATTPVGSAMELVLWRAGGEKHLRLTAEKMPE